MYIWGNIYIDVISKRHRISSEKHALKKKGKNTLGPNAFTSKFHQMCKN